MPRVFLWLGFFVFAIAGRSQIAPDIEVGTAADAVLRTYGWPKGKSVADGRESWIYDQFQVRFENGKVVSVTPLSTYTPAPKQKSKLPAAPAAKPAASPKSPATPPSSSTAGTGLPSNNVAVPRPTGSETFVTSPVRPPRNGPAATGTPTPSPPANRTASSARTAAEVTSPKPVYRKTMFESFLPILAVVLLIVALGFAVLVARLVAARRRTRLAAAASQASNLRKAPKTFEEHVAARLGNLNSSRAVSDASNRAEKAHHELTPELLRTLEWKRFELLTSLYFNATGIRAERTCVGPDGGIDVKLFRAGEPRAFSYIQCKAWGRRKFRLRKSVSSSA